MVPSHFNLHFFGPRWLRSLFFWLIPFLWLWLPCRYFPWDTIDETPCVQLVFSGHTHTCDIRWLCSFAFLLVDLFMCRNSANWFIKDLIYYNNIQFSRLVVSDSLWPHGLQHARPPCPSPTPGVYSNSCPLSWWCHPAVSCSVIPFSSCLQSFPASRSFQNESVLCIRWPEVSASVLPVNIQDWSPLGSTGLIL